MKNYFSLGTIIPFNFLTIYAHHIKSAIFDLEKPKGAKCPGNLVALINELANLSYKFAIPYTEKLCIAICVFFNNDNSEKY